MERGRKRVIPPPVTLKRLVAFVTVPVRNLTDHFDHNPCKFPNSWDGNQVDRLLSSQENFERKLKWTTDVSGIGLQAIPYS